MSSTIVIPDAPVAAPGSASGALPTALGVIVAVVGVAIALAAIAVLAVFGTDGRLDSGRQTLSTSTSALVTDITHFDQTADLANVLGDPRIGVSAGAPTTHGIFVGIAHAEDVDSYLDGTATSEVTDFDVAPFRLERHDRAGGPAPAPPTDQTFWVQASSDPIHASIDWKVQDGDYRVVVMNADGSPGVHAEGRVTATIPHLPRIAGAVAAFGALVFAGGIALIVTAGRRGRRAGAPAPAR